MIRRRDESLIALVEEAARAAAFPPAPDLAARVRARIEAGPMPVGTIDLPRTRPPLLRPVLAGVIAFVLALAVTLSLSVTARRAVADLLGVAGIRVSFGDEPPASPLPARRIPMGEPVSQAGASRRAGIRVLIPAAVAGEPAIYFDRNVGDRGMVSVVYPRDAVTLADADLLVSQFGASLHESFVKKLVTLGSRVAFTWVRSSDAYWIGGEPHLFFYQDRHGIREETVRLAGKVLLWSEDGVTYRIEGADSLPEAQRIAESLE